MDHDQFRSRFEEMGFDVSVDFQPEDDDMKPVLVAENKNGDEVYWHVGADNGEWELYVDAERFSIDNNGFDPRDVEFEGDTLVLPHVTGTRSKTTGYGRAGYEGKMRIARTHTEVVESYR